jgi:transposase InsO family protein
MAKRQWGGTAFMPWKEKTVEKSREEFIHEVKKREETISVLCMRYGVSRKTGYKWLHRYEDGGNLCDKSRAPFHTPNKVRIETERLILEQREIHPAWGPRKLKRVLEKKGHEGLPAVSTISSILKRNGYISEEESLKHKAYERFERQSPNELWQADFKGDFGMLNSERCYALTVLDDHSRYSLCIDAKGNQRTEGVLSSFNRLFQEYGVPESILCDNGNPWGTSQSTGYTKFEIWLMDLGILTIHGRIKHPQTQGKEERFHRTMDEELLKHITIRDLREAQQQFDKFRESYNTERPHEALRLDVPANHYKVSERRVPERIEAWRYGNECIIRKVKSTGYITYRNQGYFLSEALGEKEIAVRESEEAGCVDLIYRGFQIGRINIDERAIVSRKIRRIEG